MTRIARLLLLLLTLPFGAEVHSSVRYLSQQGVVAVDMAKGQILWRALSHKHTFAPVLADGRLLVGSTDGLFALDASTGKVIWHRFTGQTLYSPTVDKERLFAGSLSQGVIAMKASTGAQIWTRPLPGWVYSPALQNGVLISGGSRQQLWGIDPSTGAELWSQPLDQELTTAPLPTGMGVLVTTFSGTVRHLDEKGRTLWQVNDPVASLHQVLTKERILLAGWDGSIRYRRLLDGDLIGQTALKGRLVKAPLVEGERVLLISERGEAGAFSLADWNWLRRGTWPSDHDMQPLSFNGHFVGLNRAGRVTNW